MKKMRKLFCLILLFISWKGNAQDTHAYLCKGDKAYERDQYKEAEQHYRNAADRDLRNPKAIYNLGNTLYQQGKFEDAGLRFEQSIDREESGSKSQLADSWHNLGNAMLKQRKYKEAVKAYEQSLRFRPGDQETKMNLQMAKKKLREEMQRQQQQQQQQDQQNQEPPPNPSQQPNQPQQKDQNKQQNPEHQQEQQPSPPQQEQRRQQEQMKKEDAKRLLETAVGNEDRKNARKYRAAEQSSPEKRSKKDW